MPDGNYVEVTVSAKDDTGPGFASADAREKAFAKLMDQTTRKEIAASSALSRSYDSQSRAAKALGDAISAVQEGEQLLADHTQNAANRQGFLRTAVDGVARALNGGGSSGLLPGLLGAGGAAESAGTSLGAMGTMIVPLIALVGTLGIALFPLIAGLALVTVGIGTFAAAAIPEISKVWAAVGQGGAALKKLDPQERALAGPIRSLQGEFDKLQKAIKPEVLRAFAEGLKIIKDVMPALRPLAVAAGRAIDGLLRNIDHWLNSSSGKKFIHWMEVDGPKALATFGRVAWTVIQGIGRTLDFLLNTGETFDRRWRIFWHDAAHAIDSFRTGFVQMGHLIESAWNSAVSFIKGLIATLVSAFRNMPSQVAGAFRTIFDPLKTAAQDAYNFIVGIVSRIEGALSGLAGAVNNALGGIPGKVLSFLGLASGGIAGAASGGLRSGLKLVGEHGPELVQMPAGSRVYNAAQTQQMLGGGQGGGGPIIVQLEVMGSDTDLVSALAKSIRIRGGDPRILTQKVSALV